MKKILIILLSIFLYSCNNSNNINTFIKSNVSSNWLDIIINKNLHQFNNIIDSKEDINKIIENNDELFIDFWENISIENINNTLSIISLNQKFLKISIHSNQFWNYLQKIIKDKNINDFTIEIIDCSERIEIDKDFWEILLNNKTNRLEFSCTNILNNDFWIFIINKEQEKKINNLNNIIINNFYLNYNIKIK